MTKAPAQRRGLLISNEGTACCNGQANKDPNVPLSFRPRIKHLGARFQANGTTTLQWGLWGPESNRHSLHMFERYDLGELSSPIKDPDTGYLTATARITRIGVFVYGSGKEARRELRLPNEVFNGDSLASFGLVPFTNEHPGEALNSTNTRRFAVGTVSGASRHEDDVHVTATIQITDEDTIAAAEAGKRELSCGYKCDLEHRSGVTKDIPGIPDGLRYDAVQRNIRGNHVALVDRGRAGGSVALRFDHGEEITETSKKVRNMETIHIDGVPYEVTAQVAAAFRASDSKKDQEILTEKKRANDAETQASEQKARADAADVKTAAAEKARDDVAGPEKIREAVNARVALVVDARAVIGDKDADGKEIKLDGLEDAAIRRLVVQAAAPELEASKLDDEAHVLVHFGIVVADAKKKAPEGDKDDGKAKFAGVLAVARRADKAVDKVDEARRKNQERGRDAWKVSPRTDRAAAAA